MTSGIDAILDDFSVLDEWEDRYRYLIELGKTLEPLPDAAHNDVNKVRGCASQVWIEPHVDHSTSPPRLSWRGDSDAHIVRGLVALTLAFFNGRTPEEVVAGDALKLFSDLGLAEHLTPQRSNGVRAMVERIKADARAARDQAAAPSMSGR
ncbi:SufE family protein [Terrarubrum flagellatum]|uniref:SufE family protein n=1 Tax=Terrirubrum flagellatum TaxID=2895980 RepID=UPI003145554E